MSAEAELKPEGISRREVILELFALAAACFTGTGCGEARKSLDAFFHKHFKEMTGPELKKVLGDWEEKYKANYNKEVTVRATAAQPGVLFGYALDVSRCVGCRRCVYACVDENNLSRDPQLHWITVLEMDKEKGVDFHYANAYYNPSTVPQADKFYLPVACQHCENPPCVKVCPVEATWKEPDGIVVIDYDWCIGCRCCITACPYGARRFNWGAPSVPADKVNTQTEYLGNRPRGKGVVEKCTFCLQRARTGRYPACVEVCPVGARKFGNLLDPTSEIRQILSQKRVFILKEELNTQPKFFYYYST
jgi:molybdopterin-containing oxidoreductase family iron-sulfur binding subunit